MTEMTEIVREHRRRGGQGRGYARVEVEHGWWWAAWWRDERAEGIAPSEPDAIAAIEHFRYRGKV